MTSTGREELRGEVAGAPRAGRLLWSYPSLGGSSRLTFWVVVTISTSLILPMVASSFAQRKELVSVTEAGGGESGFVGAVTLGCNVAALAACVVAIIVHRSEIRRLVGPAALLLAAWLWGALGLVLSDAEIPRSVVLFPLIVVAVTLCGPGINAIRAIGWVTAATAALSVVMGAAFPDAGRYLRPDSLADDKFVWAHGILAGPFPSGNNLAVALAVGLPAVLCLRAPWQRVVATCITSFALFWTFSRTGWIAAASCVLLLVAIRLLPRWRGWVAGTALAALGLAAAIAPFLASTDSAFSNRGGLWRDGISLWLEKPWAGWGPFYYLQAAESGTNLNSFAFHAHNQLVHMLVTSGVVLAALIVTILGVAVRNAVRTASAGFAWPALALTAFFVCSAFEVPLGVVDRGMYWSFTLIPLLVILNLGRRRDKVATA